MYAIRSYYGQFCCSIPFVYQHLSTFLAVKPCGIESQSGFESTPVLSFDVDFQRVCVITSYSIHYTKLYEVADVPHNPVFRRVVKEMQCHRQFNATQPRTEVRNNFV